MLNSLGCGLLFRLVELALMLGCLFGFYVGSYLVVWLYCFSVVWVVVCEPLFVLLKRKVVIVGLDACVVYLLGGLLF